MVLRHQPRSQKADECALQVTTTAQKATLEPLTPPVPLRGRSAVLTPCRYLEWLFMQRVGSVEVKYDRRTELGGIHIIVR